MCGQHLRNIPVYFILFLFCSVSAASENKGLVLLAKGNGISLLNLSLESSVELLSGRTVPYSIDFFERRDGFTQIFWSDIEHDSIHSALLVNNALQNVTSLKLKSWTEEKAIEIENLAIDWIAGNIYWIVSSHGRIDVAKLDGTYHSQVVGGIAKPRGLALDPEAGFMFWSDWNEISPGIERSTLSGEFRQKIVTIEDKRTYGWLNAITLDRKKQQIYWVDAKSRTIHSCLYDGSNQKILLSDSVYLSRPFTLTFNDEKLLWSDLRGLVEADVNNASATASFVYETSQVVFGAKLLTSTQKQPYFIPECVLPAGVHCSHLCLRNSSHNARCVCPPGMTLESNGHICTIRSALLMVALQPELGNGLASIKIHKVALSGSDPVYSNVVINGTSSIKSISYDAQKNILVWLDSAKSKIYYRTGKESGAIDVPADSTSVALSSTSPGASLFVSEAGANPCISVCSLETRICVPVIFEGISSPSHLVVAVNHLVWLDFANHTTYVKRFSLEYKTQSTLFSGSNVCCLVVDPFTEEIYWMENKRIVKLRGFSDLEYIHSPDMKSAELIAVIDGTGYFIDKIEGRLSQVVASDLSKESPVVEILTSYGTIAAVTSAVMYSGQQLSSVNLTWVLESHESGSAAREDKVASFWKDDDSFSDKDYEISNCSLLCLNGGICASSNAGGSVCLCNKGFKGEYCEVDECYNFCVHGNCTLISESNHPTCSCILGWTGEKCDEAIYPVPYFHDCSKEIKFHHLNSRFQALILVSVPVIVCLSLTSICLFILWMRTRRLLHTVVSDVKRDDVLPQEKRPWCNLISNSFPIRKCDDGKALLDDQLSISSNSTKV